MPTETGGPYLAAAFFCESVLVEKDGVLSVIRIVDRVSVTPGPGAPEDMPPVPISLRFVLIFKAGFAHGSHRIKLTRVDPSGTEEEIASMPALFEGQDRGVSIDLTLRFLAKEEGLYWFGVLVNDQVFTRVPLRILYQRMGFGQGQQPPSH